MTRPTAPAVRRRETASRVTDHPAEAEQRQSVEDQAERGLLPVRVAGSRDACHNFGFFDFGRGLPMRTASNPDASPLWMATTSVATVPH